MQHYSDSCISLINMTSDEIILWVTEQSMDIFSNMGAQAYITHNPAHNSIPVNLTM